MADNIFTKQGKLVVDSSFIPYIRRQDIIFEAENLRPGKIARLFVDEIAVNQFSQKANKIVVNSRKVVSVNSNSSSIYSNDYVYQGSINSSPTFSANVVNYNSDTNTLILRNMTGNFDPAANLNIENTGTLNATAKIVSFTNSNTSDVFLKNEGIINLNNNTYMQVVGASGENILYVNENFISANIAAMNGNTLSAMTADYSAGDVVYQTPTGKKSIVDASYLGRVQYYRSSLGANIIALETVRGRLNVANDIDSGVNRLWNSSNTASKPLQIIDVKLVDIQANDTLVSVSNTSKTLSVVSHIHNSGVVANVMSVSLEAANTIYVNSTNTNTANANLIYITSGSGLGQIRQVIGIDGKKIILDTPLSFNPTHTTKYSLGNHIVDENGNLTGIINMPEEPNFKFRTGERIFTITDANKVADTNFTMKASGRFTAHGLLNRAQRIVTTPRGKPLPEFSLDNPIAPVNPSERTFSSVPNQSPVNGSSVSSVPRAPLADGLSQTFFTPKPQNNKPSSGIFVTSVDLFFRNKPSVADGSLQLPVTVKIAEVVNGFPTKNYIASSTVKPKDVNVSISPSTSNTATITKFRFGDPVYLQPDSEYAIVVSTESPEYDLYIAELGGEVLGADPPRRISEQPYAGSLFRSQNATTWTPYQNEDLMFVINKAVFSSTGTVTLNMKDSPAYTQNVDRLFLHTNELTFATAAVDYKVRGILANSGAQETSYNYIKPHTIFNYGQLLDFSNKPGSVLNSRKVVYGNANSTIIQAEMTSSDADVSPIFNKESATISVGEYQINNAGLSNTIISITNRGSGYNAFSTSGNTVKGSSSDSLNAAAQLFRETYLGNDYNVGLYKINIDGGLGTGADGFAVANTSGSNTVDYIVMVDSGSGYVETPNIVITNGSATGAVRAEAVILGETGKSGGNIKAKYLTRQFVLEDGSESGDLTIYMDAITTTGTDIQVYYKVLSSDDPDRFSDKSWVRMSKRNDRKSKDQKTVIELEFKPNLEKNNAQYFENGQRYPIGGTFKYFAIKVGLLTTDATIVPIVKNLRIIATPGEDD